MLLGENELNHIPHLYEQESDNDPIIHVRLATPDNRWACYIAEAGKQENEYHVFALFISKTFGYNWAQVPLRQVEEDLRHAGLEARLDPSFRPNRASILTGIKRQETFEELRRAM